MAAPEAPLFFQGVSRSSAAFRLLKQMGWQEGEGLGKDKQGITSHVRVTSKKDNSGVGVDAQEKASSKWTFNTVAFDQILKSLSVVVAETSPEDQLQETTVPKDAKTEAALPTKATRPQGRYKKRELGKLLKGKSQADLDAILGYRSSTSREVCPIFDCSKTKAERPSSSNACCLSAKDLEKANYSSFMANDAEVLPMVDVEHDWWGTRYGFVPAGALKQQTSESKFVEGQEKGSGPELIKARMPFCEQDQENLYNLVQNVATKSRQGLGIADRPKKVGGAHWTGQKVTLAQDDTDDGEDEAIFDVRERDTTVLGTISLQCGHTLVHDERRPKRRKKDNQIEWKQLCKQLLQEAPSQTMKIKHLHRQMVALRCCNTSEDCVQSSIFMKEKFEKKLSKSSKFRIEGRKVFLVT